MTWHILGSDILNPIGSDARRPIIIAFLIVISLSLLWLFTLATGQEDTPERLYIADRSLGPVFNGFAMAGEQMSVVTLLAIPGAIVLFGYDGFTSAIDGLVTLGVLLLLAQKIRDSGRYTLGDIFALRAQGRAPRTAAALVTLTVTIPLLLIQLRAAGISTALLLGLSSDGAQVVCTVLMGCLVACFASVADLKATSFMHVVKVPLTLATLAVLTLLALRTFGWDPARLFSAAVDKSVSPDRYLRPGLMGSYGPFDVFSTHMVWILGAAVTPHLILRVSASRSGRSARRSMTIAVTLVGVFALLLMATGFAAAAVVGSSTIGAVDPNGQASPILLASDLLADGSTGRTVLITAVASAAFLAMLTTVTSLTFAAAVSFTHDVFSQTKHPHTETGHVRALRLAIPALCTLALSLSAATHRYPVEFLITFSVSVAASCIFPALIYSCFWRRFNRQGLLWSVYGGLLLCIVLTAFSSAVSGNAHALWPHHHLDWYPFQTPGPVSVPAAFILGWLGSTTAAHRTPHSPPHTGSHTPARNTNPRR